MSDVTITHEAVLAVARAHGTTAAAEWSGLQAPWINKLRRADGEMRRPGRPSVAQAAASAFDQDCPCPRCVSMRLSLVETISLRPSQETIRDAWRGTDPTSHLDVDPDQSWKADGACRDYAPDWFFPGRGESTTGQKAVCARCPVRQQCLDYALANGERFGIWGGFSERERRRIRSSRTQRPKRNSEQPPNGSISRLMVLAALDDLGGHFDGSGRDFAAHIDRDHKLTSVTVGGAIRDGLIVGEREPGARSFTGLRLTDHGRAWIAERRQVAS